ncbi:hypothetical protein GCM10009087_38500 [Sphingomonas oligophenolica]|uniref:PilZ domain-containing protein n=1 Tax=Sphingomonas oligophenolica TaxID=301154 RepID=A0ABU9Y4T5_9SPHN
MLENCNNGGLTTASLSGKPALPNDRRQHARHVSVLRVAKINTPRSEELCLVRNISGKGMMVHVYSDLCVGDPVSTEFNSGKPIAGRIIWHREGMIGIEFDESLDPDSILSGTNSVPAAPHPRPPRVGLELHGRIRVGSRYQTVTLCNISQGGANIRPSEPDTVLEKVVLMVNGLPPIAGSVRWQDEEHAGIEFDIPVSFEVLARWVPSVRRQG